MSECAVEELCIEKGDKKPSATLHRGVYAKKAECEKAECSLSGHAMPSILQAVCNVVRCDG